MKLVVDENIALAEKAFSGFGRVELCHGRKITREMLKNADGLIVRSITNVNKDLLNDTNIKFVGTATIGWDHIDTDYLEKQGITFTSAAGCNSDAVCEYVFSALLFIASKNKLSLSGKKIGIIGIGNIGSRVAARASSLGMEVCLNDPPLARKTKSDRFQPLHQLFDCDIITLHVPLNLTGEDKTYHLLDNNNLKLFNKEIILINTSRGPVADNKALVDIIKERSVKTIIDVWENEPFMNNDLLNLSSVSTPHIAGYSIEGKINGTKIIYDALCRFTSSDPGWKYIPDGTLTEVKADSHGTIEDRFNSVIQQVYDIRKDDAALKKSLDMSKEESALYFDQLRKEYIPRREFFNYRVTGDIDERMKKIISSFRFNI